MGDGAGVQALEDIVDGSGSSVVSAPDPDDLALALVEALDAELVDADELADAVARRLQDLEARTDALTALATHAQLQADATGHRHLVTDVATMGRLVDRIDEAHRFVEASRTGLRDRSGVSSELAVHPETIRKAAAEVSEARAARQAAAVEVAELEQLTSAAEPEAPPPLPVRRAPQRAAVVRAVGAVVVALVIGVVATLAIGSPVPLVLPVLAAGWGAVQVGQHRQDLEDRDVAADNLAAVSALADRAYGGVALDEPEALVDARRGLGAADERLRYAESSWASLVGPDVDVDALDEVLAGRDAQWQVDDAELARTPTLRAAEAHARRLRAQWKLAWWALDRPVPPTDHAPAAIDELISEGVDVITVPTWAARSPERLVAEREFDRLASGRSVDELRAAAAAIPVPLVVLDEDGEITEADLAARVALLPADARVVVVTPAPADQTG